MVVAHQREDADLQFVSFFVGAGVFFDSSAFISRRGERDTWRGLYVRIANTPPAASCEGLLHDAL